MNGDEQVNDAVAEPRNDGFLHSDEFDGFAETVAALGLATEPVDPPGALRARLMAQIALTPQLAPVSEATATPETQISPESPQSHATPIRSVEPIRSVTPIFAPDDVRAATQNAERATEPSTANSSSRALRPGPAERRAARRWLWQL